jgi:hypothetical protein
MDRRSTAEDLYKETVDTSEVEDASTTNHASSSTTVKDEALEILGQQATPLHISPEQDRKVLSKIDLWLMPVIMTVYFLQQLDK